MAMIPLRASPSETQLLVKLVALAAIAVAVLTYIGLHDRSVIIAMLRDQAVGGGRPFYWGALSQIGIVVWAVGAAIALFVASIARDEVRLSERVQFLRLAGVLTTVLCLDDAFQFHELIAPKYLFIDQKTVLGLYAISALAIGWRFRRFFLAHPLMPLAAVVGLGGSVAVDFTERLWVDRGAQALVEDGLKQFGILMWAGFLFDQARTALSRPVSASLPPQVAPEPKAASSRLPATVA